MSTGEQVATHGTTAAGHQGRFVGSLAHASGQGEQLRTVLDTAGRQTRCATDALRGAAGVNR